MSARRVAVPVTTLWRSTADGAAGRSARRDSELLLGEPVLVVGEDGPWCEVRATAQPCRADVRGYPGWVRAEHLGDDEPGPGLDAVVARPTAVCATTASGPVELSFGTAVRVLDRDDPVADVALGAGLRGALPRASLRSAAPHPPTAAEVLGAARLFLGLPYRWGGTSGWGLDCSGLVHLVLRSYGVEVARDAADQAASLPEVPLDRVVPGDLYFFAPPGRPVAHVGLATAPVTGDGVRRMLHAPAGGVVVEEALDEHRRRTLVGAARPG